MQKLIYFSIFILFFTSCQNVTDSNNPDFLPQSSGAADEIMILINEGLYDDSLAKDIKKTFISPYKLLPQAEARFSMSAMPYNHSNALLKRFINIIYIVTQSDESALATEVYAMLTDKERTQAKENGEHLFFKKNRYANKQNIAILIVPTKKEIISAISTFKPKLEAHFDQANLPYFTDLAYINGANESLNEQFKKFHQLQFDVPNEYKLAKSEKNMLLLRKDVEKATMFLCFDIIKYQAEVPLENLGIQHFNKIGKYLDAKTEGSYVIADTTLGFKTEKTILANETIIYENAGLWYVENDYVGGGPFINQYIIDKKNNRIIYLSGIFFGPGVKHKKKYMREFEAIFNTLNID